MNGRQDTPALGRASAADSALARLVLAERARDELAHARAQALAQAAREQQDTAASR